MREYSKISKEAKLTGLSLILLILFWLIAGLSSSIVKIKIFEVPFWAIAGTIGVWLFGVTISIVLSRIIKDIDFRE